MTLGPVPMSPERLAEIRKLMRPGTVIAVSPQSVSDLTIVIDHLVAEVERCHAESTKLKVALVNALVPLEVLNADNHMGATWMIPSLRKLVGDAVTFGRAVLPNPENT